MKGISTVFAAALLASAFFGAPAASQTEHDESEFLELTEESFEETVNTTSHLVVMFYAPWCGACKRVGPEYLKAKHSSSEEGLPFVFARVHADDEADLTASLGVGRFPSFMTYIDGKMQRFPTLASSEAIMTHLRTLVDKPPGGAAKHLSDVSDALDWLFWRGTDGSRMESAVVGFFPSSTASSKEHQVLHEIFEQVSRELVLFIRFAEISDEDLISTFNMDNTKPALALYKDYDEGKVIYGGDADAAELKDWIQRINTPLVTSVDHFQIRSFQLRGNVLAHVFVPESTAEAPPMLLDLQEQIRNIVLPMEDKGLFSRGQLTVAVTNGEKYSSWLRNFGLQPDRFPSIGLVNLHGGSDSSDFEFYRLQLSTEVGNTAMETMEVTLAEGKNQTATKVTLPSEPVTKFFHDFFEGNLKGFKEAAVNYDGLHA